MAGISGKNPARHFQVGTADDKTSFVVLHNDETSNVGVVIEILIRAFDKTQDEAVTAAATAHMCGETYLAMLPKSIAQAKVNEALRLARQWNCPDLNITIIESQRE